MNKSAAKKQLIEEILSIKDQYQVEVGSKRKPWPKSIKTRVLELDKLGMQMPLIAHAVKVPYQTMMAWRYLSLKKNDSIKEFHALEIKNPTVTVGEVQSLAVIPPASEKIQLSDPTVTVRTPDGYVLEIPASMLVQFLSELRDRK